MSALAHAQCQLTRVRRRNSRAAYHRHRNRTKYTYDNDGNVITRNGSSISWASYNLPLTINAPGESSTWSYGPDHQRWFQQYTGPGVTENMTYFDGLLEKVVSGSVTDWRHYIFAGGEQVAVYSRSINGTTLTNTVRYTLEDHQGSPSAILASTTNPAAPLVKESFEPYGSRRDPSDWSGPPTGGDITIINGITRQGFTGQTMLGSMGLIHMNGRVMDSITGRFLSADPYITEPGNTQNFNRYGYVYNNPLSYIDPSGFEAASCFTVHHPGSTTEHDNDDGTGTVVATAGSDTTYCVPGDGPGPSVGPSPIPTRAAPPAPPIEEIVITATRPQSRDYCAMAQAGGDFVDDTLATEDSVFDTIATIGDMAVFAGYLVAPFNPLLGAVLIIGGKAASTSGAVVKVGAAAIDYGSNGNTGRLVNAAAEFGASAVGGRIGARVGAKVFGNQQIRDSLGRFAGKRARGYTALGESPAGASATVCGN